MAGNEMMATLVEVDDLFGPVGIKDADGLIGFTLEGDRSMTGMIGNEPL